MNRATISLTLIIILCAVLVFAGVKVYGPVIVGSNPVAQVVVPKPNYSKVTAWVTEKSARISKSTVSDIVELSMGSPRGLLILSVCEVESNFTPTAVSPKGAIGLGQIMYEPHKEMLAKRGIAVDRRDLFDVQPNLRATDAILAMYLSESKGDIENALRKYLGGRDGQYVFRICKNYVELSLLHGGAR